jgi:hypothetical protein
VNLTLQVPGLSILRFKPDLEHTSLDDFDTDIVSLALELRETLAPVAIAAIE